MVIKSVILRKFGNTNTEVKELDKTTPPAMEKWTIQEIRPYFSRAGRDIEAYIEKATTRKLNFHSLVADKIREPYPADLVVEAGVELRLLGRTDGTVTDVVFEVIYIAEAV